MLAPYRDLIKRTFLQALVFCGVIVIFLLCWRLRALLALIFLAYLLMLILHKPILYLKHLTRLPRGGAVSVVYIAFAVITFSICGLILPLLLRELLTLLQDLDTSSIPLLQLNDTRALLANLTHFQELFAGFTTSISTILDLLLGTLPSFFTTVLLLTFSIYLSLDHDRLATRFYWFTGSDHHIAAASRTQKQLEKELANWVTSRLFAGILTTGFTYLCLSLLGIPYPLVCSLLTGFLTIIPHVGLILAAVPVVILAGLSVSWWLALAAAIYYLILLQIDNLFVIPFISLYATSVDPFISLVLISGGWLLEGPVGSLLAIPLYIVVRHLYAHCIQNVIKSN